MSEFHELKTVLEGINRILIIGASGWLGREVIFLLRSVLGNDFESRVVLIGSKEKSINILGERYFIGGIDLLPLSEKFDLVIHLAFLTQEKLSEVGIKEYKRLNREITKKSLNICQSVEPKHLIISSSGAADSVILSNQKNSAMKLYGELKVELEDSFASLNQELKACLQTCRIWNVSGQFILDPEKYALGEFISQAKRRRNIELHTSGIVRRTYLDAGQLFEILIINSILGKSDLLDSGGYETSLLELAGLVNKNLNPSGKVLSKEDVNFDDYYIPKTKKFNFLVEKYKIQLKNLNLQILDTAKSQSFI